MSEKIKKENSVNQEKLEAGTTESQEFETAENQETETAESQEFETAESQETETAEKQEKEVQRRKTRTQRRKASFTSRKFKGGAYATVLSVIVIVLVIFINLAVGQLDLTFDLTSEGKFTLADETKEFLQGLQDEISIYYLGQNDTKVELFEKIAEQYPKASSKINLEFKDIVKNPRFASQYTEETIEYDSFLVVNETKGRSKYIGYSDLLVQEFDYSTYQMTVTGIDVEGKLDAAIQYVTTEELPTVYVVNGHGEEAISEIFGTLLTDSNISYQELNTLTSESVPEDCDVLYINRPQVDYMEEEITLIKNYLTNGGNAIICVDYVSADLKNFKELLNYYGIEIVDGIVVEGDTNYYLMNRPNQLVPIVGNSPLTEGIRGKKYVISSVASGLRLNEELRDTLTVSGFLTTSDSAFSKTDLESTTMNKEEGDIDGSFYLGVMAEETYNEIPTKVVVYSGKYIFDDSNLSIPNYGNRQLLLKTINELAGEVETISVPPTSLTEDMLVMTSAQKNRNGVLQTVVLPLLVLGAGIVVIVRRRR